MKLSENFSLAEFTKSNTAIRYGLDNTPTDEHIENLKALCVNILQPLRDYIKRPLRINSGYRGEELNQKVNGSSSSDHCKGKAADLELWIDGVEDNALIFEAIQYLNLPFYQMIWEFGDSDQPNWVHVAYREDNPKQQSLKAVKMDGKTQYVVI